MRELLTICLLVALCGCGESDKKKNEKEDGKKSASISSPMTPVAYQPQEETKKKAKQEEKKQEEVSEEEQEASEMNQAESIQAVMNEFDEAMADFRKAYAAADEDEKRKVFTDSYPQPAEYAERLMEFIEEDPATEAAAEGLTWVVARDRGKSGKAANDLLIEHHINSEAMAEIALGKANAPASDEGFEFLDKLIEESPIERVKGVASYAKLMQVKNVQRSLQRFSEEDVKEGKKQEFIKSQPKVVQDVYTAADPDEVLIAMIEKVCDEYGDVVLAERGDMKRMVGESLESMAFEMKFLTVGKTAPDIEGEDLDGEEFKLSDYRGKVVVIDFWGDW